MRFLDFGFIFVIFFGGFLLGLSFGDKLNNDNALIKKCQETNGKYDFCQEVKQWSIK